MSVEIDVATIKSEMAGLREDVSEMKADTLRNNADIKESMRDIAITAKEQSDTFLRVVKDLSDRHHTKDEIALMVKARDSTEAEQNKGISDLKKEVTAALAEIGRLKTWRAWLTGTLGAIVAIGYSAFDYLHQWIATGGKP